METNGQAYPPRFHQYIYFSKLVALHLSMRSEFTRKVVAKLLPGRFSWIWCKCNKSNFAHSKIFQSDRIREVLTASRLRVVRPHFSLGIIERAKRNRAWKWPHARKGELAFRSLYYPWGKKGTTRSLDHERSSFFNIYFLIATRGERKSEIIQISREADLNLILVAARISRFNFRIIYSLMRSWGYAWLGLNVINKNPSTEPVNCESLRGYAQRFWANFKFLVIDARTAE